MITLLLSFGLCLFSLILSLPLSKKLGLVDEPGKLKIHSTPIPIIGGILILFSLTFTVVVIGILSNYHLSTKLFSLFIGGLSLCLLGLFDDIRQINPTLRLLFEILVVLLILKSGYSIKITKCVWIWFLFNAFFLIGAINAINMLDGMDGLATGIMLLSSVGFSYIYYQLNLNIPLLISLALVGSLTAFLYLNFYPAKAFLGDNGSYFLGFMLFLFSTFLTSKPFIIYKLIGIIIIIGLPIIDTAIAIMRRLLKRQSPFSGDRLHIYDFLFHLTKSQIKSVLICYAIQTVFVATGIFLTI